MKMKIGLTEFVLKTTIVLTSHDEEPEEASEQSQRSLFKNLISPLPVQDH
jgi:hypothetical protein